MRLGGLVILLLFLFGDAATAQNINTIRGKVRSAGGLPVNNAIVELRMHGALLAQTVTRNEGDFDFSNLAPAEYEVAVTASGYESAMQFARFTQSDRTSFREVLNIEIVIKAKADPLLPPAGVNFAQTVPKAARDAYENGMEMLREGKSEEALISLRKAIEIFSDYFSANFVLARELFRSGKDGEAIEAVERARQVNDREPAVYHLFGLIMFKQRKFVVAEYAFSEALKYNAGLAAARYFRARTLIEIAVRNKDEKQRAAGLAEAEAELDKAWETSNKRLAEIHLQRARLQQIRGDKEAAARALEAYLKAEPNAPNAAQIREAIEQMKKKSSSGV